MATIFNGSLDFKRAAVRRNGTPNERPGLAARHLSAGDTAPPACESAPSHVPASIAAPNDAILAI